MQRNLFEIHGKYASCAGSGHPALQRQIGATRWAVYVFILLLALTRIVPVAAAPRLDNPKASDALIAACNAPGVATVLHAAAEPTHEARAYWIDRHLIQWPGVSANGRFRLYHSANAALRAMPGRRVEGADGSFALRTVSDNAATASAERFRFVEKGARMTLPQTARQRLRELLREQLLLVREDAQGHVRDVAALQTPGALDDLYAAAEGVDDLGASVRPDAMNSYIGHSTRFAVWAPTAQQVALCLYAARDDADTTVQSLRRDDATGVWLQDLQQRLDGREYAYLVDVVVPGVGVVRNRVTDPYSVALTADSKRSVVLDLDDASTKPAGWNISARPSLLTSNTDMTVYELHVRDFSIRDQTVRPQWRGKYLAFTDTDSAGKRHLRALGDAGITDVHLLPVFDIATIPEHDCVTPVVPVAAPDSVAQQAVTSMVAAKDCFNWGYDPYHYSVPEGSYATDPNNSAGRIREFRAMVQALHATGLRVGMDVVYNHTTSSGQQPTSVLDRIVPGYYQRLDATGQVEHSTCCENTATEHRMMAKLMIESAALWAKQYHIDSFRFDLMGHQPRAVMERLQQAVDTAAGRHIPLLGEGWNFGEIADGKRFVQASQLSLNNSGIATFSDRARDALRGGGCCDSGEALVSGQGLLSGLSYAPNALNASKDQRDALLRAADMARIGLAGTLRNVRMTTYQGDTKALSQIDYAGQPAGYAAQPGEVVNYVENHDNPTLFDILALKLPRDTTREDRARVQLLGAAFVGFSQGIAYYHAGMEVLRSKSLDRNSFDSGDWFNRLDWTYTDNGFGAGLPPESDNGKDWALLAPVLADTSIKPQPEDITWMRDAFNDLLRIRASSTLFRMRTSQDVETRLSFRNVGPQQNPLVITAHLDGGVVDGKRYDGAAFDQILYFINVSPEAQTLVLPEEAGKAYALHPVQRTDIATDQRPARDARYDAKRGAFVIPARTAVVYVIE